MLAVEAEGEEEGRDELLRSLSGSRSPSRGGRNVGSGGSMWEGLLVVSERGGDWRGRNRGAEGGGGGGTRTVNGCLGRGDERRTRGSEEKDELQPSQRRGSMQNDRDGAKERAKWTIAVAAFPRW